MRTRTTCRAGFLCLIWVCLHLSYCGTVGAAINVELRPYVQAAPIGATVNVGIYVVSDSAVNQPMSAADVMFGWDPARLDLLGLSSAGAVPLLISGFPNDGGNVNELPPPDPPQDGTGYYLALGPFGTPVQATPAGTLLTTLQFQAVGTTDCLGTAVTVLPVTGNPPRQTVVYDGFVPGLPVTGTLGGCAVVIGPQSPDTIPPVITGCPASITTSASAGTCAATVSWIEPTATDDCAFSLTRTGGGPPNGGPFPIGVTTVTYQAVDFAGNTSTCSFTVTVTDDQNPTLTNCPANIVQATDAGLCTAAVSWTPPTAADNCAIQTLVSSHAPGSAFGLGATIVTYTATDPAGHTAMCSFTVTVEDHTNPAFESCPANVVLGTDPGLCAATAAWPVPAASDNCGIQSVTSTHNPGDDLPIGDTTVTYIATDVNGLNGACAFTVTVEDNEAPLISGCPSDIVVHNNALACEAIVNWTEPTATDNCGEVASLTSDHSPGELFDNFSTTTVTYTALDSSGNTATCTFQVTVLPLPDIDDDGDFDLDDVPLFVNVLLGVDTTPLRQFRSDVNCDAAANGLDVQALVMLLVP